MNMDLEASVSAFAAPANVGATGLVFGNVLGNHAGFALGTGGFKEHAGEPAPASPPPPPPGQAPTSFMSHPPGYPPGRLGV